MEIYICKIKINSILGFKINNIVIIYNRYLAGPVLRRAPVGNCLVEAYFRGGKIISDRMNKQLNFAL